LQTVFSFCDFPFFILKFFAGFDIFTPTFRHGKPEYGDETKKLTMDNYGVAKASVLDRRLRRQSLSQLPLQGSLSWVLRRNDTKRNRDA